MDTQDDEFRRLEAARDADRKLDEFNAELSGTLSGYRSKHLPENHASKSDARQRRADAAAAQMTALEALLASDPLYRAAHERAMGTLHDMEAHAEQTLVAVRREMREVADTLKDMRGRGSVLPDGRKVYRDEHGKARTEEGEVIEGPKLDGVVWREGSPRYEEVKAQRERAAQLQRRESAILHYQTEILGHARGRLSDKDNPPSLDELREIEERIKEQAAELQIGAPDRQAHGAASEPVITGIPKL